MEQDPSRRLSVGIERQIRDDRAQALVRITEAYEKLAESGCAPKWPFAGRWRKA